jgi:serine/threonine protein kinase
MAAITKHKAEAIKLAREQGVAVQEMCRRAKTEVPPYEFEELIGKGAYGRVYKGHQTSSGRLVAIKVLDIDSLDYKSLRDFRDESIKDFIHETKVMKQVKDSGAKNINELIEAISIHSQLWLVCEYCPGGSVRTLMRATNDKLDEKFIIPIARELAVGLRAIHEAGIIHRDVKAANILVHEEGRLEICDFGVAGVLQSQRDKRSTWIGTPHWMPPEMFATRAEAHRYGSEIDVWAYGCTLFEFANGNPPNAGLRERMQIGRQLNRKTPQLDSDKYSQGLKDLIAYALDSNPATRPTMEDILAHPYIANTEEEYPTSSVSELVRNYYQWSQRGGQRISLFHPGGAAAAELPGEGLEESDEDWNFSTTDGFERRFSVIDLDQIAASLAEMQKPISPTSQSPEPELYDEFSESDLNYEDKANFDERVRRGAVAMERLFDEEMPSYTYETKNDFIPIEPAQPTSDLPLRADTDRSSVTSTFLDIDIGSFEASHYAAGAPSAQPFQLVDANTIRANRSYRNSNENSSKSSDSSANGDMNSDANLDDTFVPSGPRPPTMDWKFPSFTQPEDEPQEAKEEPKQEPKEEETLQAEKRATMQWTFPVMGSVPESQAYEDRHDTLRAPLAEALPPPQTEAKDEPSERRPSTSASNASDSDYDPFRFDRPETPPGASSIHHSHFFDTEFPQMMDSIGYAEYEASGVLDGPGPDEEEADPVWRAHSAVFDTDDPISALPTAVPIPETPTAASVTSGPVSEPGSPVFETIRHARHESYHDTHMPPPDDNGPIPFPALVPPSSASLLEGADDALVTAELDRLLGDFLGSLSATGEAVSRAGISQDTNGVHEQIVEEV